MLLNLYIIHSIKNINQQIKGLVHMQISETQNGLYVRGGRGGGGGRERERERERERRWSEYVDSQADKGVVSRK